jgi:hypothetical protein
MDFPCIVYEPTLLFDAVRKKGNFRKILQRKKGIFKSGDSICGSLKFCQKHGGERSDERASFESLSLNLY